MTAVNDCSTFKIALVRADNASGTDLVAYTKNILSLIQGARKLTGFEILECSARPGIKF